MLWKQQYDQGEKKRKVKRQTSNVMICNALPYGACNTITIDTLLRSYCAMRKT